MKYLKTTTQILFFLLFPSGLALAQSSAWIDNVTNSLLGTVLPTLVDLLAAFALLYFLWGMVVFISKSGDESGRAEGKQKMIWGIIALFVLVSAWSIVYILQTLVGAGGATTPVAPQINYAP